jgi:hypothetical protein
MSDEFRRKRKLTKTKIRGDIGRGNRMSPTHAIKRGVRYRYYVSHAIACLLRPATPSSLSGLSDYRGGRVRGRYRAEPNTCLNWYPDKGIRFMANWVNVLQLAAPFDRSYLNGMHPNIFLMRAQVNW